MSRAKQLDREITEVLSRSPRRMTVHVHLGPGLKDGIRTAGTGFYLRKLRELGATVTLAKTGRATVHDASGNVTVYTVDVPETRAESDALLALNPNPESPLSRALADLTMTTIGRPASS